MGTPDPNNLYVGAGAVYFDRFDSAGLSTGLRHLGNVETLGITASVETIEKKSSLDGARGTLKEVVIGSEAVLEILLSEYDSHNVALALFGTEALFNQASEPTVVDEDVNGGLDLVLDRWYPVNRLNITVTDLKEGLNSLILDTDFEVNSEAGMVRIISGGAEIVVAINWSGSVAAMLTERKVDAMSVGKIEGRLRFQSAADQAAGPRLIVDVWKTTINPDGAIQLINEEFGTFTLGGKVQKDATRPVGEQFFRAVYL